MNQVKFLNGPATVNGEQTLTMPLVITTGKARVYALDP